MDIWVVTCRKRAKCHYCPKFIEAGDYMVKGKLWRKTKETARMWCRYFYWHLDCWKEQAIKSIELREHTETRGRKQIVLSDEDKKKRFKILRKRTAVVQRLKAAMQNGGDIDKIIHLGDCLNQLKEEIEPLGGVPKSWK